MPFQLTTLEAVILILWLCLLGVVIWVMIDESSNYTTTDKGRK